MTELGGLKIETSLGLHRNSAREKQEEEKKEEGVRKRSWKAEDLSTRKWI